MEKMRLYTAGIADFESIRQDGRIYIDKTELIYSLCHESQFVFLSRPRRFGKSLLCSTLKYYFQGRKDLFEDLAIAELEKEWKQYPVLHFDMNGCKDASNAEDIMKALDIQLKEYEDVYGKIEKDCTPGMRLSYLIHHTRETTGMRVVVIIDNYDNPILGFAHTPEWNEVLRIFLEFTQPLKANDADEQFVFITGLTELPYEHTLNNFSRMSHSYQCNTICGITYDEMISSFEKEIKLLAETNECFEEEIIEKLHLQYGGYRFGNEKTTLFNPYCLMKAFETKRLGYYWGTNELTSFLKKQLKHTDNSWNQFRERKVGAHSFYQPLVSGSSFSMLYENGIITIKDYDFDVDMYTVGFPNVEAKELFSQLNA